MPRLVLPVPSQFIMGPGESISDYVLDVIEDQSHCRQRFAPCTVEFGLTKLARTLGESVSVVKQFREM